MVVADELNRAFGFWRSSAEEVTLPSIEDWMDPQWNPTDKPQLMDYLVRSPVVIASASMRTLCSVCGELLAASNYQSDGEWLWPQDLAHYVKSHSVRLPDNFCAHIRQANYCPPLEVKVPFDELPWPE